MLSLLLFGMIFCVRFPKAPALSRWLKFLDKNFSVLCVLCVWSGSINYFLTTEAKEFTERKVEV